MTNQEAIKTLYEYRHCLWDKLYEPIRMAIKALEQESCEDISPTAVPVTVEEAKRLLHTEWKKEVTKDKSNDRLLVAYKMAVESLEQKPKTGHWKPYLKEGLTDMCSECGSRFDRPWNYCPHCGARMESEDKE